MSTVPRFSFPLVRSGIAACALLVSNALQGVIFTVTNTNASGAGSLLEAVSLANNTAGPDEIHFAIPGPGVHTIALTNPLGISDPVVIDGYTQPGASPNTLAVGNDAVLRIELDCTAVPTVGGGVFILSAANITIRGLVMNRASVPNAAIRIAPNSSANVIIGNFLGTDPTGLLDGNNAVHGVLIGGGSNHRVGGTAPADRNVISGNGLSGVSISSSTGNLVQGNYIGLNAAGTSALGNGGAGVSITVAANSTVGGTAPGAGNVISANGGPGISIGGTTGNVIQGNYIGTDATGAIDLGNASDGIRLSGASSNTIGGPTSTARNVISGNGEEGIDIDSSTPVSGNVIQGNFIGLNAAGLLNLGNTGYGINIDTNTANSTIGGTAPGAGNMIWFNGQGGIRLSGDSGTGNAIRGNSIFSNPGLGIELAPPGVTANDPGDIDTGPNNLQNFPVIDTATSGGGSTNIQGTLHSSASSTFQLDFFSIPFCDDSGHGEGKTYLGSTTVNTDGSGNGSFNVTLPVAVALPGRVAATATDAAGNTSEFSACISLAAQFHTVSPCRVVDTRDPNGPYGGPALAANTDRSFTLAGSCGIPATAQAVSLNFTVTGSTGPGHLTVYPLGSPLPLASTMNFSAGQTRANNAIVPLGAAGAIVTHGALTSGTVHLIIDTNGYFE